MTVIYDNRAMLRVLLRVRGSVLPSIKELLAITVLLSVLAVLFMRSGDLEGTADRLSDDSAVSYLVAPVAFLVVFRSNISYERFWAGRTAVGHLRQSALEIVRLVAAYMHEDGKEAQEARKCVLRLVLGLVVAGVDELSCEGAAVKNALDPTAPAGHPGLEQLTVDGRLMFFTEEETQWMQNTLQDECGRLPQHEVGERMTRSATTSVIAQWLSEVIASLRHQTLIDSDLAVAVEHEIGQLVAAITTASDIRQFQLPYPYVQMLHAGLVILCVLSPLTYVDTYGWVTVPLGFVFALAFFGINAVSMEITDPFGEDPNDLPMGSLVQRIARTSIAILRQRQAVGGRDLSALQGAYYSPTVLDFRAVLREVEELRRKRDACPSCGRLRDSLPVCPVTGLRHGRAGDPDEAERQSHRARPSAPRPAPPPAAAPPAVRDPSWSEPTGQDPDLAVAREGKDGRMTPVSEESPRTLPTSTRVSGAHVTCGESLDSASVSVSESPRLVVRHAAPAAVPAADWASSPDASPLSTFAFPPPGP
eukprot:TRINITY_DN11359_c0_g1_i1.p1 TRINITY_DN11359_c0_g1~~TRINITY_DN11359_c0_g1_i1.p1  ORF type:complete len:534 (+),score=124.12 TRINITY_DN11359_c0_g1_i1:86-1687(+)